jgi:hypothetical protein
MRDIAPTLAGRLGLGLTAAEGIDRVRAVTAVPRAGHRSIGIAH